MKLAVSSIAWNNEEETDIAELLLSLGVKYIEIAPTKIWDEPISASDEDIEAYRRWWLGYGIEVVAFQSILFTHPDYKLFEDELNREKTVGYIQSFTRLAARMGVKRLIFGSPRNRQIGDLKMSQVIDISKDVFTRIGDVAKKDDIIFCIEPNAVQYSCDFVTTAAEGIKLVDLIDNEGFGLHLDTACMTLAGDNITESIQSAGKRIKHFHISSPMLDQVSQLSQIKHVDAAKALKKIDYNGFVSIEMKPSSEESNVDRLRKAILFAQSVYGA